MGRIGKCTIGPIYYLVKAIGLAYRRFIQSFPVFTKVILAVCQWANKRTDSWDDISHLGLSLGELCKGTGSSAPFSMINLIYRVCSYTRRPSLSSFSRSDSLALSDCIEKPSSSILVVGHILNWYADFENASLDLTNVVVRLALKYYKTTQWKARWSIIIRVPWHITTATTKYYY